jgi:hypothetical protein
MAAVDSDLGICAILKLNRRIASGTPFKGQRSKPANSRLVSALDPLNCDQGDVSPQFYFFAGRAS